MPACCIMLSLLVETALLKRFQQIRPDKTKTGYLISPVLIGHVLEKRNVKMTIIPNGCNNAHNMPKYVCLYLTLISRHVKK